MGRSLISVYALAVCFCTLMCLVIVLGIGLYDLVRIVAPQFTLDQSWIQTDAQFLAYYPQKKELSAEEIKALRAEYRMSAVQGERHVALQRFVWLAIIATIDGVVYALHWRLARSEQARTEKLAAT
jgi:hypothetical protein